MITGWCAPPGVFNEWTFAVYRWSQATTIKFFPYQIMKPTPDPTTGEPDNRVWERIKQISPQSVGVIRMHDCYWDWEHRQPSAREWANAQLRLARLASDMGIKYGQFDNEPNYRYAKQRPDGTWDFSGEWEYRQLLLETMQIFAEEKPFGFKVIAPPMMIRWDSRWKDWYKVLADVYAKYFDHIGIDEYYQDPLDSPEPPAAMTINEFGAKLVATGQYDKLMPQRYHVQYGWAHEWLHNLFRDKKIWILENNTSWIHREPTPDTAECYQIARAQVPAWNLRVHNECPYVAYSHIFTLPGSGDGMTPWRGFLGTEILARAMGRAVVCGGLEN